MYEEGSYICSQKIAFVLGLAVSVHMVLEAFWKKNKSLFLFSLFLILYLLITYYQIFLDVPITIRYTFYTPKLFTKVLLIHVLFLLSFWLFWRPEYEGQIKVKIFDNTFIWWTNILICIIIFFCGQKGESILNGAGYGGNNLQTSSLNDYIVIFLFMAYKFSGKSSFKKNFLNVFIILFIMKTLLLGSRGGIVFVGLFIFNLDWHKRVSLLKLILLFLFVIFTMQLFEKIRSNPVGVLEDGVMSVLVHEDREFIYNNQSEVYYSSIRMMGLIDSGLLPVIDRITSFFYFLLSVFVPYSLLPPLANLSAYKQELYSSGGGGLISIYTYVWGGCFLTILMGAFVSYISSNFSRFRGEYLAVYALFIISQIGTWFPYNPIGLFKICFYAIVVEFIFLRIHLTFFIKKQSVCL